MITKVKKARRKNDNEFTFSEFYEMIGEICGMEPTLVRTILRSSIDLMVNIISRGYSVNMSGFGLIKPILKLGLRKGERAKVGVFDYESKVKQAQKFENMCDTLKSKGIEFHKDEKTGKYYYLAIEDQPNYYRAQFKISDSFRLLIKERSMKWLNSTN